MPDEPQYRWDADALRFRDARGRYVAPGRVREAVDRVAGAAADQLEAIASRLTAGTLDLYEFERRAREVIRRAHAATAEVAVGGRDNLTASDRGRVANRLRREYEYLRAFVREIDRGEAGSPAMIAARVRLYGEAATTQYETARRQRHIEGGWTEERRALASLIPCVECIDYAARGWVPIGTLPRTGDECSCKSRCKCQFEYRKKRRGAA